MPFPSLRVNWKKESWDLPWDEEITEEDFEDDQDRALSTTKKELEVGNSQCYEDHVQRSTELANRRRRGRPRQARTACTECKPSKGAAKREGASVLLKEADKIALLGHLTCEGLSSALEHKNQRTIGGSLEGTKSGPWEAQKSETNSAPASKNSRTQLPL